jgi:hypothetical protein
MCSGPRVLRCGYSLAADSRWWPSQVILDGMDITNVPTDFSAHENGRLEVVFTQHPARIQGTVVDASGQPVRAPWIAVGAADPALRQHWSSMWHAAQGNTRGNSPLPWRPDDILSRPSAGKTFRSVSSRTPRHLRVTSDGMPVQVTERREIKDFYHSSWHPMTSSYFPANGSAIASTSPIFHSASPRFVSSATTTCESG